MSVEESVWLSNMKECTMKQEWWTLGEVYKEGEVYIYISILIAFSI